MLLYQDYLHLHLLHLLLHHRRLLHPHFLGQPLPVHHRPDRKEHTVNEIHKFCQDESKIHRIDAGCECQRSHTTEFESVALHVRLRLRSIHAAAHIQQPVHHAQIIFLGR